MPEEQKSEHAQAVDDLMKGKDPARRDPPEPIMQFFRYDHLPPRLADISKAYGILAQRTIETCPRNPERTVALRKLLEAKDAAVRAALYE